MSDLAKCNNSNIILYIDISYNTMQYVYLYSAVSLTVLTKCIDCDYNCYIIVSSKDILFYNVSEYAVNWCPPSYELTSCKKVFCMSSLGLLYEFTECYDRDVTIAIIRHVMCQNVQRYLMLCK